MRGASANIEIRKEQLKGYYEQQEALKSGIEKDYQEINHHLNELNILSADIRKHNSDFANEIIKTFPKFFKLGRRSSDADTTTTTSSSLSSTSPTFEYPLSRSNRDPNLKDKLKAEFRKREESQHRQSSELDRSQSADSSTSRKLY